MVSTTERRGRGSCSRKWGARKTRWGDMVTQRRGGESRVTEDATLPRGQADLGLTGLWSSNKRTKVKTFCKRKSSRTITNYLVSFKVPYFAAGNYSKLFKAQIQLDGLQGCKFIPYLEQRRNEEFRFRTFLPAPIKQKVLLFLINRVFSTQRT